MTKSTMVVSLYAVSGVNRISYKDDEKGVKTCILNCYDVAEVQNYSIPKKEKLPNGDIREFGVEMAGVGSKSKPIQIILDGHLPDNKITPAAFPCAITEIAITSMPDVKKSGKDNYGKDLPAKTIIHASMIVLGSAFKV